tara:strand:+ start:2464 stop:2847 length:384 start_codon:yes stop_codon:yes gene_type:complete
MIVIPAYPTKKATLSAPSPLVLKVGYAEIVLKNSQTARWGQIWENKIPNYSNFDGVKERNQLVGERFPTFPKFAAAAKSFSTESGPYCRSLQALSFRCGCEDIWDERADCGRSPRNAGMSATDLGSP